MFLDTLNYPIRRGGWVMMLMGAIFAAILNLGSRAPLVGFVVAIFSAGYFAAYYLSIIGTTMNGHDHVPEWPGFNSFYDDILVPYFQLILLVLVSFAPALILGYFASQEPEDQCLFAICALAAIAWGGFYFPIAVLANLSHGGILSVSPHLVLPAIIRCLPGYLLDVIWLASAFILVGIAEDLLTRIPYLGWALATILGVYSLMYQARLIGLIYRRREARLAWS